MSNTHTCTLAVLIHMPKYVHVASYPGSPTHAHAIIDDLCTRKPGYEAMYMYVHSSGGPTVYCIAVENSLIWLYRDTHVDYFSLVTQPKIIGLNSIPTAVRYRIKEKEELESST